MNKDIERKASIQQALSNYRKVFGDKKQTCPECHWRINSTDDSIIESPQGCTGISKSSSKKAPVRVSQIRGCVLAPHIRTNKKQ